MKIINELPHLQNYLRANEQKPTAEHIDAAYVQPISQWLAPMIEDFAGYRGFQFGEGAVESVEDWSAYRAHALALNPDEIESHVRHYMAAVEKSFGHPLEGEVIIYGAMTMMDGYARFNLGKHRVFLGLDDFFESKDAMGVLIAHELTHVLRESQPTTWSSHGLPHPIEIDHDRFTQLQPAIEHLFSEGLSCLHSEILNPGLNPWHYVYQNAESYAALRQHAADVDRFVHHAIMNEHYRMFYNLDNYASGTPMYAHYAWAWKWLQSLYERAGTDVSKVWKLGSKDLIQDALKFKLASVI